MIHTKIHVYIYIYIKIISETSRIVYNTYIYIYVYIYIYIYIHSSLDVLCTTMNSNVLSTAMALAVLDSLAGPLHIYNEDAFALVLEKIGLIFVKQDRRVTKVPYPSDKLEGYDIDA